MQRAHNMHCPLAMHAKKKKYQKRIWIVQHNISSISHYSEARHQRDISARIYYTYPTLPRIMEK